VFIVDTLYTFVLHPCLFCGTSRNFTRLRNFQLASNGQQRTTPATAAVGMPTQSRATMRLTRLALKCQCLPERLLSRCATAQLLLHHQTCTEKLATPQFILHTSIATSSTRAVVRQRYFSQPRAIHANAPQRSMLASQQGPGSCPTLPPNMQYRGTHTRPPYTRDRDHDPPSGIAALNMTLLSTRHCSCQQFHTNTLALPQGSSPQHAECQWFRVGSTNRQPTYGQYL
jgi:hypothetical protein